MPRWKQRSKNAPKIGRSTRSHPSTKAGSTRSKAIIVPDWKYVRRGSTGKLADALKYYQYRLDRGWSKDEEVRELCRDRWVDLGLGKNWNQILDNCGKLHGR